MRGASAASSSPVRSADAVADAIAARRRAGTVLDSLLVARMRLESRLTEGGRRDPIKAVTGHSAIENAIASTKAMIAALDRLVRGSAQ